MARAEGRVRVAKDIPVRESVDDFKTVRHATGTPPLNPPPPLPSAPPLQQFRQTIAGAVQWEDWMKQHLGFDLEHKVIITFLSYAAQTTC